MMNFARKLARSAPLHVSACLFVFCLLTAAPLPAQEQLAAHNNKPAPRKGAATPARAALLRRVVLRGVVVAGGSRVTITSDVPLDDYAAYRQGGRFLVRVPDATAAAGAHLADGAGFTDARVEQSGDELVVSFRLEPGAAARVVQKFNRLEVVFSAQQDQQSGAGNGGNANNAAKPADAKPTPSPAPSPTTNTAPPVSAPDGAPTETKAAGTTEAAKATAEPATTKAARYAALLTPEKKSPVKLSKFDKAPVIDGKLDDEVWKSAARFKDFIQNRPGDLIAPSKQTEAYIGYDAKTLYIAFKAYDEPDKVRSTVAKRDAVFDDDWVGVWLDTFNDGRRAYELIFNPLGVQADAIFTEGVNEDFSVDIVHESKGALTTDGYVVEIAIPFKSLRYTAGKDKLWGLHLLRTIKRFNNEQSSWMPISRDNSSLLGQRGYITGLEGISAERTLEIIPSLTISETGRRVNSPVPGSPVPTGLSAAAPGTDRLLNKPIDFDPGITTKFTITPQVTLDFTYNPDFAQVEADATVVTANQRFPIFFEEKRPFFLEGKEIFETLISAVHTRAIVDPDYAVKLTGKQGRNTFGIMAASDNAPGNLDDDDRDFIARTANTTDPDDAARRGGLFKLLDRNATIGVVRLKRDVGKENHVGLLATTYNFVDKYNHVAGADTRWRLNKTTTFTAQVMASVSHQPFFYPEEAGRFDRKETGMVYGAYLNMNGRNWGYELGAVGRSKRFRADVGFNRRFDTNNPTVFVRYNSTEKPKRTLVGWRASNFFGSNFDWKGRHQRYVNESQFQFRMQRQTFIGLGFEKGYERVFEDEFGGTRAALSRVNRDEFAPLIGEARAGALPACDPGGLAPVIPDDPATEDVDETRRLGPCTFFGPDNERSADRTSFYWYVETRPSKKYSIFVFSSYNHGVLDFDFGSGSPRYPRVSPAAIALGQDAPLDPGAGNEFFLESTIHYQPTDALRLSLYYTKDRLSRHDTGRLAFDDNIFSLRGTYQFTRFWFARGRVDYTTLSSRMRMQYLLGWTPNPGTQFYVGYNDDLNRNGFNPFDGALEPGFRRNGRTFFIKMSYLFRKSFGSD